MLFQGDVSKANLLRVFKEILILPCEDDAVAFDVASLQAEEIRVVTPPAKYATYPVLLSQPVPNIRMYPPETSFAES